jgi:putative epimerase/dehydratase
VRLWTIPSSLVSTAFKVGDILHLPINTNILNKLTGNFFISNQKLKDAINVEKLPSSTQEGLLKTLNSIKDK